MNFPTLCRAPATARGDEDQMPGQRLGVSPFPSGGRSASILVRLTLQQKSEKNLLLWHSFQPKESFMRFAVIACVIAAGIWTKTLKDNERALMLTGNELPRDTFT